MGLSSAPLASSFFLTATLRLKSNPLELNRPLNHRAAALCDEISGSLDALQVAQSVADCGTTLFDFGVRVPGSIEAGLLLARVCLADGASVSLAGSAPALGDWAPTLGDWPRVAVSTDQPVAACMASQYAGWEVQGENYFAMGSGPMRAASGREALFDAIGYREQADRCVGVLESAKLPTDGVCRDLAAKCGVEPRQLILLVAPTSSQAGTLQVVARSVETVLHKLHELGFDLLKVQRGTGEAPLCPVAVDDLTGLGVTNDSLLYGGRVTLEVTGDDTSLQAIGERLPSSASKDYGRPFAEILATYNNDFYRVDPLLFSAAQVTLVNIDTGNRFEFGKLNAEVLRQSFDSVRGEQA